MTSPPQHPPTPGSTTSKTRPTPPSSTGSWPGPSATPARRTSTGSWPRWRTATSRCGASCWPRTATPCRCPSPTRGARFRAWLARRLGSGVLLPMLLQEEGREVKGYLNLYQSEPDGAVGPDRPPAGQGVEGARRDPDPDERGRGRAVAPDRRRRLPPQRGLRLQRRTDRQLRPGGRDDRRPGQSCRRRSTRSWWPAWPGWWPTRSRWARRAISPPRASGRCSSTRSRWRRRRSG